MTRGSRRGEDRYTPLFACFTSRSLTPPPTPLSLTRPHGSPRSTLLKLLSYRAPPPLTRSAGRALARRPPRLCMREQAAHRAPLLAATSPSPFCARLHAFISFWCGIFIVQPLAPNLRPLVKAVKCSLKQADASSTETRSLVCCVHLADGKLDLLYATGIHSSTPMIKDDVPRGYKQVFDTISGRGPPPPDLADQVRQPFALPSTSQLPLPGAPSSPSASAVDVSIVDTESGASGSSKAKTGDLSALRTELAAPGASCGDSGASSVLKEDFQPVLAGVSIPQLVRGGYDYRENADVEGPGSAVSECPSP